MTTVNADFCLIGLPYCLVRRPDGRYVAINRDGKPIGFHGSGRVKYEDFPVCFHLESELTEGQLAALAAGPNPTRERIYLYSDGCIPTANNEDWLAYSKRLQLLAGLGVVL